MITEETIADKIKEVMKEKNISSYKLESLTVLNKQQIYSVLRMGNPARPDYQVSSLLKVLNALEIKEIDFK